MGKSDRQVKRCITNILSVMLDESAFPHWPTAFHHPNFSSLVYRTYKFPKPLTVPRDELISNPTRCKYVPSS